MEYGGLAPAVAAQAAKRQRARLERLFGSNLNAASHDDLKQDRKIEMGEAKLIASSLSADVNKLRALTVHRQASIRRIDELLKLSDDQLAQQRPPVSRPELVALKADHESKRQQELVLLKQLERYVAELKTRLDRAHDAEQAEFNGMDPDDEREFLVRALAVNQSGMADSTKLKSADQALSHRALASAEAATPNHPRAQAEKPSELPDGVRGPGPKPTEQIARDEKVVVALAARRRAKDAGVSGGGNDLSHAA